MEKLTCFTLIWYVIAYIGNVFSKLHDLVTRGSGTMNIIMNI